MAFLAVSLGASTSKTFQQALRFTMEGSGMIFFLLFHFKLFALGEISIREGGKSIYHNVLNTVNSHYNTIAGTGQITSLKQERCYKRTAKQRNTKQK